MKINSSICVHHIGLRFFHFHIRWRDKMSARSDRRPEKLIPPLISQIFPSDITALLESWRSGFSAWAQGSKTRFNHTHDASRKGIYADEEWWADPLLLRCFFHYRFLEYVYIFLQVENRRQSRWKETRRKVYEEAMLVPTSHPKELSLPVVSWCSVLCRPNLSPAPMRVLAHTPRPAPGTEDSRNSSSLGMGMSSGM